MLIHPAAAQQATKFKGFFIGMSKKDAISLMPQGYRLKQGPAAIGFVPPNAMMDLASAMFDLDPDGTVTQIYLNKSIFGAEEMPGDQFMKAIVSNYGVGEVSCETKHTEYERLNGVPKYITSTECTGYSKNGELVQLTESRIKVTKPRQKPSFN
ncbi:hypothetical protein [Bradyrhizobium ottawaense]|nr:hypothetical protein [Bradyrhizobium ottawaense]